MSSMEPEVRDFLKRIVLSVFVGLSWLILNMTLGIYFGLLFFETKISLANIIFYFILVGSLGGLVWFLLHTWKTRFPHN
jgi:hypothetical protein